MTRAERAVEAQRLRSEGLIYREIADRMGVSLSYAQDLVTDPDGAALKARKDSYRGACRTCGNATDGSNGAAAAPTECLQCSRERQHEERYWTAERIVAAMQDWARRHGRLPSASEWRAGSTIGAAPEWPTTSTVQKEMGGWNEGLRAAGFEPYREFNRPFHFDPTVRERAAAMYEAGASLEEVGRHFGVSGTRIQHWLVAIGVPRRKPHETAALKAAA